MGPAARRWSRTARAAAVAAVAGCAVAVIVALLAWDAAVRPSDPAWQAWFTGLAARTWWPAGLVLCVIVGLVAWARGPGRSGANPLRPVTVAGVLVFLLGSAAYGPCLGSEPWTTFVLWLLSLFGGSFAAAAVGPEAAVVACRGDLPLALETARFLAVITVFAGATAALFSVFHRQLEQLRVRWARDLDVVVGLDRAAVALIRELLTERADEAAEPRWYTSAAARRPWSRWRTGVAVIHPNESDPLVNEVRQLGALVFLGAPDDPDTLLPVIRRGARGVAVRRLFAIDGSQRLNTRVVDLAQRLIAEDLDGLVRADPSAWLASEWVPRLVARFDDPREARDWRLSQLNSPGCLTDALSSDELLARGFVDQIARLRCSSPVCAEPTCRQGPCTDVLLLGDGPRTVAILDELALQHAFRAEQHRAARGDHPPPPELPVTRVWVSGTAAALTIEEWRSHAAPAARGSGMFAVAQTDQDWDAAAAAVCPPGALVAAIITSGFDPSLAARATRLTRMHSHAVVFAPTEQTQGIEPIATVPNQVVVRYGATMLDAGRTPDDSWTVLARQQHEVYRLGSSVRDFGRGSRRPWRAESKGALSLPDFVRADNIRQQRMLLQGAAALIGPWGSAATGTAVSEDEITVLARAEHERWFELRRQHGWEFAAPPPQLTGEDAERWKTDAEARRQNPNLIDWTSGRPLLRRGSPDPGPQPTEGLRSANADQVRAILSRLWLWGIAPQRPGVSSGRYRRRGLVTAAQLLEDTDWVTEAGDPLHSSVGDWWVIGPEGTGRGVSAAEFPQLYAAEGGNVYRRVGEVAARRTTAPETVVTLEGPVHAEPGSWVVTAAGESWVVPAAEFARGYESAEPPA